jgi:hypothetical protein
MVLASPGTYALGHWRLGYGQHLDDVTLRRTVTAYDPSEVRNRIVFISNLLFALKQAPFMPPALAHRPTTADPTRSFV